MYLIAGWSSPVARQAHNLKVVGSNPAPATNNERASLKGWFFVLNLWTINKGFHMCSETLLSFGPECVLLFIGQYRLAVGFQFFCFFVKNQSLGSGDIFGVFLGVD